PAAIELCSGKFAEELCLTDGRTVRKLRRSARPGRLLDELNQLLAASYWLLAEVRSNISRGLHGCYGSDGISFKENLCDSLSVSSVRVVGFDFSQQLAASS